MKKNYEVEERYLKVVPINLHSFVKIVGIECYEKIVEEYGGGGIYIPSQKKHDISKKNRAIYEDDRDKNMNYRDLRKKYKLSETTIRKIIDKCLKEDYKNKK